MEKFLPQCANCPRTYCQASSLEKIQKNTLPEYCPIKKREDIVRSTVKEYKREEIRQIYIPATITSAEAYATVRGGRMAVRPRIKEIIEFGKIMEFKRIGVAFCHGFQEESKRLVNILEEYGGFTVASVICKCGGIDQTELQVPTSEEFHRYHAACNPLLQAKLLNQAKTDLNLIVGLCLGHDILFTKAAEAPVTTLIVKDRLLGHNPVMALYSSYHQRIFESQARK